MNRLDAIMASRHGRPAPTDEAVERELRALTDRPEWPVFLAWLGCRLDMETVERDAPNVSALLLIEGRRSLFRELQGLREQVNDDRRRRRATD